MKKYRYGNAIIRVYGKVNRQKIEEATIIFLKKSDKCKKNKLKEKSQNGNCNTRRDITKE